MGEWVIAVTTVSSCFERDGACIREGRGLTKIGDLLQRFLLRRDSNQEVKLPTSSLDPQSKNQHTEDDGARRVQPPLEVTPAHTGQDTEAIDHQIITMILPQNPHLGIRLLQTPAPQEEDKLGRKGGGHGNDGGEVEVFDGFVVVVRGNVLDGDDDQDGGHAAHEEAEHDVAGVLQAGFAGGVLPGVDFIDGAVGDDEENVGEGVEDGVGHGWGSLVSLFFLSISLFVQSSSFLSFFIVRLGYVLANSDKDPLETAA